jgi:hypothetical protein
MVDENAGTLLRKGSKRQRVLKFFRSWKQKQSQQHDQVAAPVRPSLFPSTAVLAIPA